MSKVLKTAAVVVGAVALVATGIGAAAAVGIGAGGAFGLSATAVGAIGAAAGVASAALTALAGRGPSGPVTGNQTSFAANPDDGLPLLIGRTSGRGKVAWRPSP